MKKIILTLFIVLSLVLVACGPTNTVQPVDEDAPVVTLSGSMTPYQEFNQEAYDEALAANKKIYLQWYATWCPSCQVEQEIVQPYFDSLENEDIVGFRVNFKDKDTDANEKAITKLYQVTSQTTKVYIVDGEVVHKTPAHYSNAEEYDTNFAIYFG